MSGDTRAKIKITIAKIPTKKNATATIFVSTPDKSFAKISKSINAIAIGKGQKYGQKPEKKVAYATS